MVHVNERIQSRMSTAKRDCESSDFGALIPAAKLLRASRSR
jgi:hypothetical protein